MLDFTTEFGKKVKHHLERETFVWFTTVGADLSPQPRPVWFIWQEDSFLIFSRPDAHKVAHLRQHPNVCLHFNSDDRADEDVIVILGKAEIDPHLPPAHEVPAYLRKYQTGIGGLGMTPVDFSKEYAVAIQVTPTKVRGW